MAKLTPISGYPEWLPEQKRFEQSIIDRMRRILELSGFLPIETRSVEPLPVLLSKGDDKEIYVIKRLHATEDEVEKLGLHFDLTVPFARYVEEFQSALVFPFKRYQMQKVWRGERKQEGRYREFMQCDVDIVAQNQLPLHMDAEMVILLTRLCEVLPVADIQLKLSHRQILQGFYLGLGVTHIPEALRCVDKLAKIGEAAVLQLLQEEAGLSAVQAEKAVALGRIKSTDTQFVAAVKALEVEHPVLEEGLLALTSVMTAVLEADLVGHVEVDLSIARGLDYYTGTVYEGYLQGHEHIGAICSGGRYDELVGGANKQLPGVGVSIGLTRILGYGFEQGLFATDLPPSVSVLIILTDEPMRRAANQLADVFRRRGIGADVYHQPQNFGKQMRHAEKRHIPYVWFMQQDLQGEVKCLATGEQCVADARTWQPSMDEVNDMRGNN